MFKILVRYCGEKSWHYYGSCESPKEATDWVDTLNSNPPGKTAEFKVSAKE